MHKAVQHRIAGKRYPAKAGLRLMYDPKSERMKL